MMVISYTKPIGIRWRWSETCLTGMGCQLAGSTHHRRPAFKSKDNTEEVSNNTHKVSPMKEEMLPVPFAQQLETNLWLSVHTKNQQTPSAKALKQGLQYKGNYFHK